MGEETPMGLSLQVPDSVAQAMRLPGKRLPERLLLELAVTLYAQELLPLGKARELAGMTRQEFGHILGQRGIERHYGKDELEDDLVYARRE
jgi:predicted HTH domain antitoxin